MVCKLLCILMITCFKNYQ